VPANFVCEVIFKPVGRHYKREDFERSLRGIADCSQKFYQDSRVGLKLLALVSSFSRWSQASRVGLKLLAWVSRISRGIGRAAPGCDSR